MGLPDTTKSMRSDKQVKTRRRRGSANSANSGNSRRSSLFSTGSSGLNPETLPSDGYMKDNSKETETLSISLESHRRRHSDGSGKVRNSLLDGLRRNSVSSSFWTNLANKQDIWEEKDEEDQSDSNWVNYCTAFWETRAYAFRQTIGILSKDPLIILWSMILLGVLLGASITLIKVLAQQEQDEVKRNVLDLADQTGKFFSDQLDQAILPLFSMAQFVHEIDIFKDLPNKIGPAGENGSLPFKPWEHLNKTGPTHREVEGVCDDPDLVARFNQIASTIKKNSKMERVLVNVQLAPEATVCLLYPLINTEDFDDGIVMDNTGAVGHDLLTDIDRKSIAEVTIPSDEVVIAGPLSLVQCKGCAKAVEQAFIARLAIEMDGHSITVQNKTYPKWGFAVVLINWKELVDRSGIYERFSNEGKKFQLTRTDKKYNTTSDTYSDKVVVLAQTKDFDPFGTVLTRALQTTNNQWEMHVQYDLKGVANWEKTTIAGAVVFSVLFALLFMAILIEKKLNKMVLEQLLPGKSLKKVSRGKTVVEKFDLVTVFFSDIVGYTSMSEEMRPIQVMKMLNEFYTELDKIADKYKVYKMETIGDAYMVTGGAPYRCTGPEGAEKVVRFALEVMEFTKTFRTKDGLTIAIRAGINSGPLVAGVVGTSRPKYTIFGDTVNVASRMESNSEKGKIQVSESTYFLLQQSQSYNFSYEDRGMIPIKGKGEMHTFFVTGSEKLIQKTQGFIDILDEYEDSKNITPVVEDSYEIDRFPKESPLDCEIVMSEMNDSINSFSSRKENGV